MFVYSVNNRAVFITNTPFLKPLFIPVTLFAGPGSVVVYAPSSVKQGEGLLMECRVNHTLNITRLVSWGIHSTKTSLCFYDPRSDEGSKSCMQGRALTWMSANSSYFYLNSTQLSDSGKYACTVKITGFPRTMSTKTVVVYSEYILVEAASFTGKNFVL